MTAIEFVRRGVPVNAVYPITGGIGRPVRMSVLLSLLRTRSTHKLFHSFQRQDTSSGSLTALGGLWRRRVASGTAKTTDDRPVGSPGIEINKLSFAGRRAKPGSSRRSRVQPRRVCVPCLKLNKLRSSHPPPPNSREPTFHKTTITSNEVPARATVKNAAPIFSRSPWECRRKRE